jgi:hypothetical protein
MKESSSTGLESRLVERLGVNPAKLDPPADAASAVTV